MYFNKKRIIAMAIGLPLMGAVVTGVAIGHHELYIREDTITGYLCPPIKIESISDSNAAEGFELSKQVVAEGSVLVKNDNNVLPLKDNQKKVNVFGHGAIDWIIGGSGSGQVISESGIDNILFLDALDHYGITYNTELTDAYRNWYGALGTVDSLNQYYEAYYKLYEPQMSDTSVYSSSILSNAKSFSDTALVVISRRAGETEDPPRHQNKVKPNVTDNTRHYLEISTEEEDLLRYVGENYQNVVVIINSTNTMELDFLETIPGLDSCLIVGATGTRGAEEIPYILWGEHYPSGRTVDTYPYSFSYNINYNYSGLENVHHYNNGSSLYPHGVSRNAGVQYTDSPSYVDYVEGIYVGYKWFETADKEGYWNKSPYGSYDKVVQYPFGYGLSYTSFDWEVLDVNPSINSNIINTDEITIKVGVTNTGDRVGKDVIEAYITAPYKIGEIEKAYVSLVGINKTPEINPGESMEIELKIKVKDFESYDCYDLNHNDFKGYELEQGTYELKLMSDSHHIKKVKMNGNSNVDAVLTYNVKGTIKVENDEVTNHKVENRFTGNNAEGGVAIDGKNSNANIPYISRANFPDISTLAAPSDRAISDNVKDWNIYSTSKASSWDNATGKDFLGRDIPTSNPSWGVNSGSYKLFNNGNVTDLGYKLGSNYDDTDWDKVLNSIPLNEAVNVMNSGSFGSTSIDAVGKPTTHDYDGPAQVRSFNAGNDPGTGFPCATVLAQTFSPLLAYQFGLNYGKEMNVKGVDGAYAFGCNIHRSPFQGRNYEYMSEDGNLTGIILSQVIIGLKNTGKYSFLKHLVVAESEHEREAMYTWLTEQSLREIYLKPFQKAIQDGGCVGIMSSYNRLGGIWAGGSEYLIEGILRYEWGFKGAIVTDYADNPNYMNGAQSNRAGSNLGLNTAFNKVSGFANPSNSSSARLQHRIREGNKQILYMILSSKYQNQVYNSSSDDSNQIVSYSSLSSWVWWKPALFDVEVLLGALSIFTLYLIFRPWSNKKEEK